LCCPDKEEEGLIRMETMCLSPENKEHYRDCIRDHWEEHGPKLLEALKAAREQIMRLDVGFSTEIVDEIDTVIKAVTHD